MIALNAVLKQSWAQTIQSHLTLVTLFYIFSMNQLIHKIMSETATKLKANQPQKKKILSEKREIKFKQKRRIESNSNSDKKRGRDCG